MHERTKRVLVKGWVVGSVIYAIHDGLADALRALHSQPRPNPEPAYLHKQYLRDRAKLRSAANRISV
jgi:hypothetical protein